MAIDANLRSLFFCPASMRGITMSNCRRHYGLFNFIFDLFMCAITGGLWLIWIFVREMRNR